jgi:hypothetical protein
MRLGWKSSSASVFSPVPISLIGLPVTARIDSAAPPRPSPSDPRQHDAGEADALVEGAREIDRVLAGQRVRDQQHFMRVGGGFDLGRLAHHVFVERGAAGGVEQHHVVAAELGRLPARVLRSAPASGRPRSGSVGMSRSRPQHGQLLHRRRAVDVERGHQHLALVALGHAAGELGGGRGFAGALQTDHHDRHRRHGIEVDGLAVGTERGDQFVMDDLDHHLAGRDRLDDGGADRLLADAIGEISDNLERDVGFQQRAAHLAHRGIDVALGQRAAARQADREFHQAFPTDCRTMPLSFVLPLQALLDHHSSSPRRRGIQYAAALGSPSASGILDHPPSRV